MKYYLDITLLPDAEASLGFLWFKIYQQIHLLLVENKVSPKDSVIAVSFPHYGDKAYPLGNKLRLLATSQSQLSGLAVESWLSRFADYVHIKGIKAVPENVTQFACFKRWQYKSPNKLRLEVDKRAQYLANKNNLAVAQVKERLLASIDSLDHASKLPFINLTSLSTDKTKPIDERRNFKLFIERELVSHGIPSNGVFTCYGLSRRDGALHSLVPWFD
jgi:CRISPR-associated endonuclease Csy4